MRVTLNEKKIQTAQIPHLIFGNTYVNMSKEHTLPIVKLFKEEPPPFRSEFLPKEAIMNKYII